MKKKSMVFIGIFILILIGGYLRIDSQEKVIEKELYNKVIDIGVPKEKISKTIYRKDYLKGNRTLEVRIKGAPDEYHIDGTCNVILSELLFNFNLKKEIKKSISINGNIDGNIYDAYNEGDYKGKNPKDYIPEDIYKYLE